MKQKQFKTSFLYKTVAFATHLQKNTRFPKLAGQNQEMEHIEQDVWFGSSLGWYLQISSSCRDLISIYTVPKLGDQKQEIEQIEQDILFGSSLRVRLRISSSPRYYVCE